MTNNISFRRLSEADLSLLMEWRVTEDVTRYMYTDPVLDKPKQEA